MKIDDDIYHIAQSLLDQKGEDLDEAQSTIYCFYDTKRIESDSFYKNDDSVSKMAELGLLKVISYNSNNKPIDTSTIRRYFYFQVEFSPKKLKEYLRKRKNKKEISFKDEVLDLDTLPVCIEEKTKGYLKYNKFGQKIPIGNTKSRHYRFLRYMLDPMLINTYKSIETVFEEIRLPKDEIEHDLSKYSGFTHKKLEIIQFCIKELQKEKKLQGKIKFELNPQETHIKTVILH